MIKNTLQDFRHMVLIQTVDKLLSDDYFWAVKEKFIYFKESKQLTLAGRLYSTVFHCSSGDRKTKCQHKFDKSLKMSELKKRQQCSCRLQQREKKNNGLVWITETEWGTSNLLRLTKYRTAWYFLITSREKRKMRNRISVNESVWGFYHSVTVLAHWTINENSDWGNITATSQLCPGYFMRLAKGPRRGPFYMLSSTSMDWMT